MAYIQSMAQPEKVDVKLQLRETAKDNDLRQKEQEKQNEEMEKQLEEPALAQARESNEQRLKEEIRRREAAGAGVFAGTLGGKKSHLIRNVAIAGGVIVVVDFFVVPEDELDVAGDMEARRCHCAEESEHVLGREEQ